ncbi:MAG: hypothetical protein Q9209_004309 [Squamulea sp. 1 TL-2023]
MALRNELRTTNDWQSRKDVNWATWYGNMTAGADAIYKANPDLLIFFSGLNYDSRLRQIFSNDILVGKDIDFNKWELAYADKIVLEVHDYDMDESNCTNKKTKLTENAFAALGPASPQTTIFPLVMSEWGFAQTSDQYMAPFASCLREFLPAQKVGWMTWVLVGSYYIRAGVQDYDETWGLLDHTLRDWRCPDCINKGLVPMVNATLHG